MTTQVFATLALRGGGFHRVGGFHRGGGGLFSWLLHLYVWHLVGRAMWSVWRIHAVGPLLVVAIGLALVGLVVLGGRHGMRRRGGGAGGSFGYGTGSGPRDW